MTNAYQKYLELVKREREAGKEFERQLRLPMMG